MKSLQLLLLPVLISLTIQAKVHSSRDRRGLPSRKAEETGGFFGFLKKIVDFFKWTDPGPKSSSKIAHGSPATKSPSSRRQKILGRRLRKRRRKSSKTSSAPQSWPSLEVRREKFKSLPSSQKYGKERVNSFDEFCRYLAHNGQQEEVQLLKDLSKQIEAKDEPADKKRDELLPPQLERLLEWEQEIERQHRANIEYQERYVAEEAEYQRKHGNINDYPMCVLPYPLAPSRSDRAVELYHMLRDWRAKRQEESRVRHEKCRWDE